jgi:hypothetical protein
LIISKKEIMQEEIVNNHLKFKHQKPKIFKRWLVLRKSLEIMIIAGQDSQKLNNNDKHP